MKKIRWVTVVLVLALQSLSCQLFAPTANPVATESIAATDNPTGGATALPDSLVNADSAVLFAEPLPVHDAAAPLPSPGAAALRALASLDPGMADLTPEVEKAERAAMEAMIKDLTDKAGSRSVLPALHTAWMSSPATANPARGSEQLTGYHRQPATDGVPDTSHDAALIAALTTGLSQLISDHMPPGNPVDATQATKDGNTDVLMTTAVNKSADGSSLFGMGIKTKTDKSGKKAKIDFAASVEGQRCPTAEGQVSIIVKFRLGADSGAAAFSQDLTANVVAVVDDNAEIATTTIDVEQSTRQLKDGRDISVESGNRFTYDGEGKNFRQSKPHLGKTRAAWSEINDIVGKANDAAFNMARAALIMSRDNWREGGCVKIVAKAPGKVNPGSATPIDVTVMHKYDGSTVASKLDAALSGESSLAPTTLAKTPGVITYTAPGENGKSATIKLKGTSRRGIATLDLTATTQLQSYTFDINHDGAHITGTICSLDQPFSFDIAADGYSWTENGVPSNSTSGQLAGSPVVEGCTAVYAGPYTVTLGENGYATMNWTNNWDINCPDLGHKSGVDNVEIPLQPVPEGACQ